MATTNTTPTQNSNSPSQEQTQEKQECSIDLETVFASCEEEKLTLFGECVWSKKMTRTEVLLQIVEMIHLESKLGEHTVQIGDIIKFKRLGFHHFGTLSKIIHTL
jgi:hypothetical protein